MSPRKGGLPFTSLLWSQLLSGVSDLSPARWSHAHTHTLTYTTILCCSTGTVTGTCAHVCFIGVRKCLKSGSEHGVPVLMVSPKSACISEM